MKLLCFFAAFLPFLEQASAQTNFWQWGNTSLGHITIFKNHVFVSSNPLGLLQSTDNGSTWTNLGLINKDIRKVAVTPNGYIFVPAAGEGGIYFSADSGKTWIEKTNGMGKVPTRVIVSSAAGQLYAGTWVNGLYKSTNNGDNWVKISNAFDIYDIHIDTSGNIFTVCVEGVYRSTDSGSTWTLKNNGLTAHNMIGITQNNKGDLFTTTWSGDLYRSTNNGDNWTSTNVSKTINYVQTIVFDKITGAGYAATDSGIYSSTNDFQSWVNLTPTSNNILSGAQHVSINSDGYVFATFISGGLLRSTNPHPVSEPNPAGRNSVSSERFSFTLQQNYPNPFNPSTTVQYEISIQSDIELSIYNSAGQLIRTFREGNKASGIHSLTWNGRDDNGNLVSSGTYYYQLKNGDAVQSKKMLLLK